MKIGTANQTYTILGLDDDQCVTDCDHPSIMIDQYEDEKVEVWKEREDGFLFVYCNRLELGYWVLPSHIDLDNGCGHNWVRADNEVVTGGEVCTKCHAVQAVKS